MSVEEALFDYVISACVVVEDDVFAFFAFLDPALTDKSQNCRNLVSLSDCSLLCVGGPLGVDRLQAERALNMRSAGFSDGGRARDDSGAKLKQTEVSITYEQRCRMTSENAESLQQ